MGYDDDFLEESLLDELRVDGGHPVHSVAPWQTHTNSSQTLTVLSLAKNTKSDTSSPRYQSSVF